MSDRDLFVVSITRESIRSAAAGLSTGARTRLRPLSLHGWAALQSRGDSDIFCRGVYLTEYISWRNVETVRIYILAFSIIDLSGVFINNTRTPVLA